MTVSFLELVLSFYPVHSVPDIYAYSAEDLNLSHLGGGGDIEIKSTETLLRKLDLCLLCTWDIWISFLFFFLSFLEGEGVSSCWGGGVYNSDRLWF